MQVVKGGSGRPLIALHDEMGPPGWMNFHESLARDFSITAPAHPGYGDTPYLDWIMNMRDMAGWYLEALDDMDFDKPDLVGFGFGGWLAAEMATMHPNRFNNLVLVNPMESSALRRDIRYVPGSSQGIPYRGLSGSQRTRLSSRRYVPRSRLLSKAEQWEVAREQSCRLAWRPYMYYRALPNLLSRLKSLPTQIIWGRENAIVPLSASQVYRESIPGSRLDIIDDCGHRPEIERPDEFVRLVKEFLLE